MHDPMWGNVPGTGVPIFFVNSGFLITLLLVREHKKQGRIDWGSFYARRAFRLLPVYFFALLLFTVLVIIGLAENPGEWWHRFGFFVTLQNEFVPGATFSHTWTLAVQEKFYLAWPLLAFALLSPVFGRARLWLGVAIVAVLTAGWIAWPANYSVMFIPLVLGAVLAMLMSMETTYRVVSALANPIVFAALIVAAMIVRNTEFHGSKLDVPFSFVVFLLMPAVIVGPLWLSRLLTSRILKALGTWAYSIYLLHPLVLSAVDIVIKPGRDNILVEIVRYVLVVVGTAAFAFVTYRLIEKPSMDLGAQFIKRRAERRLRSDSR
jgi:peptidoglycan/LPS O-acetylase OafA/YrhL